MNWADSGLEETPTTNPEPPTGNTVSCYLCARSFQGLPSEYVIRRDYEYNLEPNTKKRSVMVRYFVSFCVWCAHQHRL